MEFDHRNLGVGAYWSEPEYLLWLNFTKACWVESGSLIVLFVYFVLENNLMFIVAILLQRIRCSWIFFLFTSRGSNNWLSSLK